jgi:hypothetical protein
MNTTLKWLLILATVFVALLILVDQGICNRWVYHDYAAGIDRRLECFWK